MSWTKVIIIALVIGVYTGLVMLIKPLKDTSFQDIGITYDRWVLFAVIIVVNCKNGLDAALKCFAFFIISQPVIFGVEVLAGAIDINQASYYLTLWSKEMLLTFPGGFIAYQCKRQNALGAIVLGLGVSIVALLGVFYLLTVAQGFPGHLWSAVFCIVSSIAMCVGIQKSGKRRLIVLATVIVATICLFIYFKIRGQL